MHASKLALTVWFWAAYLMATHSNGISALQLQKQLGIGSYRSAWLLAHKLRQAMVEPERNPLSGLVEIDEASLPFRTRSDPPGVARGRSHDGKMLIIGAIELRNQNTPGRLRLAEFSSYGARSRRPRITGGRPDVDNLALAPRRVSLPSRLRSAGARRASPHPPDPGSSGQAPPRPRSQTQPLCVAPAAAGLCYARRWLPLSSRAVSLRSMDARSRTRRAIPPASQANATPT